MRILAVDDSAVARTAIRRDLLPAGYQVLEAASGEEALGLLAHDWPDLVVLDVHMRGINGFETCRRIRALEETMRPAEAGALPVIFVTTDDSVAGRMEGFGAGAVDFIAKPFAAGRVREVVDGLLGRPDLRRAPQALVVDDSPLVRRIVIELLEQIGMRPHGVGDGQEALARLQAAPGAFSLVVTDYVMARMNGDALCVAIREDARLEGLPVLAMSSLDDAELFRRLICAGASDFVRKPFVKEVFLNRVGTLLRGRSAEPYVAPRLGRFFAQSGFREALARFGLPEQSQEVMEMLRAAGALHPASHS